MKWNNRRHPCRPSTIATAALALMAFMGPPSLHAQEAADDEQPAANAPRLVDFAKLSPAAQRQIAARLTPGVATSDPPNGQLLVHERYVPEQLVLTEQRHVYVGQLIWTQQATARLAAQADRCGGVAGKRFVVFHGLVSADSDGPVEVCVPVNHPPDEPAELAWRVEPAHREAFIQVTKAHFEVPAILSVYDQLAQWVSASDAEQTGSPREVYVPGVEPLFAAADTHICDVAIPFGAPD